MKTLYSNPRFEVCETPAGHVFVTDHAHVEKKTEAAGTTQGHTIRELIAAICDEQEPDDATGLVEFLDDECYNVVYRDQKIHERITAQMVARSGVPRGNLIFSVVR